MSCPWKALNQRYHAIQELSRGGSSSVYLARDARAGGRLTALKVFRFEKPESWDCARQEFEVLRRIHHRDVATVFNLGRVREVELANGQRLRQRGNRPPAVPETNPKPSSFSRSPEPGDAFLAFEYIDGLNLREAFLRVFPGMVDLSSRERWRPFCEAIARIVGSLDAIHAQNLVHHDIKPENLLLIPRDHSPSEGPPRFDVKLIDFGFAQEETTPLGQSIRGTVPYIAPEVLSGSFADGRSDLYSLGIALIHAISGSFPFPVDSLESWVAWLRDKKELEYERLPADLPPEMAEFIRGLTQIDPDDRLANRADVMKALSAFGVADNDFGGSDSDFGDLAHESVGLVGATRIPTVGWERELEEIRNEFDALGHSEAAHSLLLVDTDEESYPQRLVEEVEVFASLTGCRYAYGRARWPSPCPYVAVVEVIRHILSELDLPAANTRRFDATLSALLPERHPTTGSLRHESLPRRDAEIQLVENLADFLIQAATTEPLVLVFDNLELADRDTLRLLDGLAKSLHRKQSRQKSFFLDLPTDADGELAPPAHDLDHSVSAGHSPDEDSPCQVLLVGVFRHADSPVGTLGPEILVEGSTWPVDRWAETEYVRRLTLPTLSRSQIGEWLKRRYPGTSLSAKTVEQLHESSGGRLLFVDEMVRGLGLVSGETGSNGFEREFPYDTLTDPNAETDLVFRAPNNLVEIGSRRLQEVSGEEREILEILAVAGGSMSLGQIQEVLGDRSHDDSADGHEKELHHRIERLAAKTLINLELTSGNIELGWIHKALRQQCYTNTSRERRQELHARLLDTLLSRDDGDASEAAAHHALRCDRVETFVSASLKAADRYRDLNSVNTSIRILEELLSQLSSEAESSTASITDIEEIRWKVLKRLGETYCASRDFARALEKFTVLLSMEDTKPDLSRRSELYRLMGENYEKSGDRVNALYFIEKSIRLLESQPMSPEKIQCFLSLAHYHDRAGHLEKSEAAAQQALDLLGQDDEGELFIRACLLLGSVLYKRNNHSASLAYNLKALNAARASGDVARTLESTEALGTTYMSRGEYEKAIEYFTRGMELATLLGSKRSLARIYNQIGTIHHNRANYFLSLENFQSSLGLWEELEDRRGIANSYNNIGLALCLKDDLTPAAECFRRAIEIFSRIGDEYGQTAGMNHLALILEMEGKYHDALEYAFRSLEKRKQSRSKSGMAFAYYRIGKIYQAKGELDKSLGFAEKALRIRREIGEKMGLAHSKIHLADLLCLRGRLSEALDHVEEGEKEFEILENTYGKLVAWETRGRILIRIGDLEQAAKLLESLLTQARQGNQQVLAGKALLNLARLAHEKEDFAQAEKQLERVAPFFRENQNRRELAELHLEWCRLSLDRFDYARATSSLDRAYTILEDLGIRDLVPLYFLLRGRLEIGIKPGRADHGRKFLERALVEAREKSLPEINWRVHYRLGIADRDLGDREAAASHFASAVEILEEQSSDLSEEKERQFFALPLRRKLFQHRSEVSGAGIDRIDADSAEVESGQGHDNAKATEPGAEPRSTVRPSREIGELRRELSELKTLNHQLRKLQEISKAINSERDVNRLLETIMDVVLDLMGGERGFLILRAPASSDQDSITVARGIGRETLKNPEAEISHSISAEVVKTGRPVLTTNAILDDRFSASKSVKDLRLLSVVCVPLRSHDETLGALYVDNQQRHHAFGKNDLRILEDFAAQATTAIKNARLSEELQHRNEELTVVNKQMEALNQRLLKKVHERTSELELTRERMRRKLSQYESHFRFHNLLGKSTGMQVIFQNIRRVAPTQLPVLIQGHSGTGKELIARAIYANSSRKKGKFISENCAALSESLLESELFGHIRGAFTGATSDRQGLFELADRGTLFLDEVGEMSLAMQKKLLRVLEEGELRRVGGKNTIKIDVRVIAASNRDLRQLITEGSFREDLYYRLNGVRIDLPPLTERREDIPLLAQHFLDEIVKEAQLSRKAISPEAMRLLLAHSWPGNVRELKHFLERTVLLMEGDTLRAVHCNFDSPSRPPEGLGDGDSAMLELGKLPLKKARDEFVKVYVERCFQENDGNVTQAAKSCGMSRESFHRFLKKYKISRN